MQMYEFFEAAFPWIVIGLVVAVGCVYINKKDKHRLEQISKKAEHIFNEIKSNRKNSLNGKNTEITEDNIIFKSLRRLGYIDKIVKIISDSYNILNSLP